MSLTVSCGGRGRCGNCYGAEADPHDCCDTCESVRAAYTAKGWAFNAEGVVQCQGESVALGLSKGGEEGCRVSGDVDLTTVNGNVHIAPHTNTAHGAGMMTIQVGAERAAAVYTRCGRSRASPLSAQGALLAAEPPSHTHITLTR